MKNKNQISVELKNIEMRLATLVKGIETNPENSVDYLEAMKVTLWRLTHVRSNLDKL